jgi:hypothetical protein
MPDQYLPAIYETKGSAEAAGLGVAPLHHHHHPDSVEGIRQIVGLPGPRGDPGDKGDTGPAVNEWYSAEGNPSGITGAMGDFYLREDTGDIFEKTGIVTWTFRCNLAGQPGLQGPPGERGSTWFYGNGTPVAVVGARAGDAYLDTDTGTIYVLE